MPLEQSASRGANYRIERVLEDSRRFDCRHLLSSSYEKLSIVIEKNPYLASLGFSPFLIDSNVRASIYYKKMYSKAHRFISLYSMALSMKPCACVLLRDQ